MCVCHNTGYASNQIYHCQNRMMLAYSVHLNEPNLANECAIKYIDTNVTCMY